MSVGLNANAPASLPIANPVSTGGAGATTADQTPANAAAPGAAPSSAPVFESAVTVSASNAALAASNPSASGLEDLQGVDSGLDDDGVRLMALQLQQALGGQSASIANGSTQSVLALFRN